MSANKAKGNAEGSRKVFIKNKLKAESYKSKATVFNKEELE